MRRFLSILLLVLLATPTALTAGEGVVPGCDPMPEDPIPPDKLVLHEGEADYKVIPDAYIVLLFPEADVDSVLESTGVKPDHVFRPGKEGQGLSGFTGKLDADQIAKLQALAEVEFIEQDGEVTTQEVQQAGATWGLDRVDQRYLALSGDYWYYLDTNVSPTTSGTTTHTYIIDTGVNYTHNEFAGRISAAPGWFFDTFGGTGADCHGHGTHVAGTAGGVTFGVAKDTWLHSVRVLNCWGSGTWGGVIAGVNWVTANHVKPAVANMSLGGGRNWAANRAVNASVRAGVFYAVAAGNWNWDACWFSPASAWRAFAVAATDNTDTRAGFSNYGRCVNIFAPGVNITSAWIGSNTATAVLSGTSMASPHVAGSAALYLSIYPWAPPSQVAGDLINSGTPGVVSSPGPWSPNLFVHSKAKSLNSAYSGSVAGFQSAFEPMGVPYYSPVSGAHEAQLSNTSGATLTLRLRQFQPGSGTWLQVATATGVTPHVIFHGGPGTYSWEVFNPAPPGSPAVPYTFLMSQP